MTIEQRNDDGNVVTSVTVTLVPLIPENLFGVCGTDNPNYCRVVGRFPKKKVRGAYCVTASTTEGICVPLE